MTFIPMHLTVDDVSFCDGLESAYVKNKSRASTARKLPDEYMGFMNTWAFAGQSMTVNSVRHGFFMFLFKFLIWCKG